MRTEKRLFREIRALQLDIHAARKHLICEKFRLLIIIFCFSSLFFDMQVFYKKTVILPEPEIFLNVS